MEQINELDLPVDDIKYERKPRGAVDEAIVREIAEIRSDECGEDAWGQFLPTEILLRIFKLTIANSGPVPTMCR